MKKKRKKRQLPSKKAGEGRDAHNSNSERSSESVESFSGGRVAKMAGGRGDERNRSNGKSEREVEGEFFVCWSVYGGGAFQRQEMGELRVLSTPSQPLTRQREVKH